MLGLTRGKGATSLSSVLVNRGEEARYGGALYVTKDRIGGVGWKMEGGGSWWEK